ncbi:MAG: GIN domain-containing protein [Candidatus Limnocylindrales bacterium]
MPARAPRRAPLLLVVAVVVTTALAISVAACVLPPLSSQTTAVQGAGDVTSEDRTTTSFRHISVGAGMKVVVRTGSEPSVTLAAQPNLLDLITTDVNDDQLAVEVTSPGIASTEPITLTIRVQQLESITLSAGATGTIEIVGGSLAVDISAGSTLLAIGELDSLTLTASSGATARLGEVRADSATVTLTGGSSVELHVTGAVTGTADGGSTLRLTEKPASVDVRTSGGASVQGG